MLCSFQKKPYLCIAFETEVYGRLAQLVQSIWFTPRGSGVRIPQRPPKNNRNTSAILKGRLAQLVQSIWFTPRGSGVRIPQRPHLELRKRSYRVFCKTFFLLC